MKIEYPLHWLTWQEFEDLVIAVCHKIIGIATLTFSDGPDGGRDAFYEGVAANFPSDALQWKGQFVIQSKHTRNPIASCSDSDFTSEILDDESVKIAKLINQSKCDNYIVFTNRKLSAAKRDELIDGFNKKLKKPLKNISIIGSETVNSYLRKHNHIVSQFHLDELSEPLRFYEHDLQEIILFIDQKASALKKIAEKTGSSFKYVDKKTKNRKNKLSEDYFDHIKAKSLQYFHQIDVFLRDPKNKKFEEMYSATTMEINSKIVEERDRFDKFESIINRLHDYVLANCTGLTASSKRKLIFVLLHYMYYNCDIGRK